MDSQLLPETRRITDLSLPNIREVNKFLNHYYVLWASSLVKVRASRLIIINIFGIDAISALDPNEIHASGLMSKLVRDLRSSLGIMSQKENDLKDEFKRLQPRFSSCSSSSPNSAADVNHNNRLKLKADKSIHGELQEEDDDDEGQFVTKSIVKHFDLKQQVSKTNYVINPRVALALSPDESPIAIAEEFLINNTSTRIINGGGGDGKYYLQLNLVGGKQIFESIYDDNETINKNNINSNSSS